MKKNVFLIFTVLCLLSVFIIAAFALPSPSVEGDIVNDASAGQNYTIEIKYKNINISFVEGVTIGLSWDENRLELLSLDKDDSIKGSSMLMFVHTDIKNSNENGVCKVTFADLENFLNSDSGTLVRAVFKVRENAKGSMPITIEVDNFGTAQNDIAEDIKVTNAGITIKGASPETGTTSPASTSKPEETTSKEPAPQKPDDPLRDALIEKFPVIRMFESILFDDLQENSWYYTGQYIQLVYNIGLMEGQGNSKFAPDSDLTIAEAVTLASRIHNIYSGGTGNFAPDAEQWFKPYVNYAVDNGIIERGSYSNYDKKATRSEMVRIFANSLPETCFRAINSLEAIHDIPENASYKEAAFKLYNAGIIQGDDVLTHTFRPDSNIRRSEVAAIVIRMIMLDKRITF